MDGFMALPTGKTSAELLKVFGVGIPVGIGCIDPRDCGSWGLVAGVERGILLRRGSPLEHPFGVHNIPMGSDQIAKNFSVLPSSNTPSFFGSSLTPCRVPRLRRGLFLVVSRP